MSNDKALTIRYPATANLMIDSADRPNPSVSYANNFTINKNQALVNGFFSRIGVTEVVFDWFQPNLGSVQASGRTLSWDLSGAGATTGTNISNVVAPIGFYTAADLIDFMVAQLNAVSTSFTPNVTWTASSANGIVRVTPNIAIWAEWSGVLSDLLNINTGGFYVLYSPTSPLFIGAGVDLRPLRYIDIVSEQLTVGQNVKDGSTNQTDRQALVRWYFSYDNPPELDAYGLPILMGYTAFSLRRIYNPPKQIKYDIYPSLGNLSFQLYDNLGKLVALSATSTNFLLTLQLSES
jgi:hypothetical protein